jgi:hypothetical protein
MVTTLRGIDIAQSFLRETKNGERPGKTLFQLRYA